MKKIMFFTMMMVLALAVGSAYAGGSGSWAAMESDLPHNGITVFSAGPVEFDNVPILEGVMSKTYEGSAAGGWRGEEAMTELHPYNGVTIFSERAINFDTVPFGAEAMIGFYEEGAAAGGLHAEEAALPENGITVFSTEPVAYDSLPASW